MRVICGLFAISCVVFASGCGESKSELNIKTPTEEEKKLIQQANRKLEEEESQGSIGKYKAKPPGK